MQVVAKQAPNSFVKCAEQATYIKALIVNDGMPALWITLNPFDLKSTMVLKLAGVCLETDGVNKAISNIHATTVTMNPVAVAQFFAAICNGIFEHLLAANTTSGGLLGPVSTYFGTVKTNGQGMLHLHCLIWLRGAFHIDVLQKRLILEPEYAD